jgi:predicted dinucleotide-binding enzyme
VAKLLLTIFVADDDSNAKATVSKLIEHIGFAAVDTGSLREGGSKQQPGSPIYNNPMTSKLVHECLTEMA